jgi:hypothetical protein
MVEVIDWKDNDDGSADVTFSMTEEEKELFCKLGILHCIQEGINSAGGTLDE